MMTVLSTNRWGTPVPLVFALLLTLALTACGGGGETETLPPSNQLPSGGSYNGPAPQTTDVQRFKISVWDNLWPVNRCGECHRNDQAPNFVRDDDINLAYAEANALVNLSQPAVSRLVEKVGGGHNCWLESDSACAETMTQWIENWAGESLGGEGNTIELVAPVSRDAGASKSFPAESQLFADTVYPLAQQYCARCHSNDASIPQSPYFASDDINAAYEAAKSKIDLDAPARSRLVLRLGSEFHNCWSNCGDDANEMQAAIQAFTDQIALTELDPSLVVSKALRLSDGVVASSGGRYEQNAIALWQFKTGNGSIAYDTSGLEPALNLSISGDVEWLAGWGLKFNSGKAQATTSASRKLYDMLTATGEYSLEAWVAPANVVQEGPARIISYSAGTTDRNFTLGQTQYNYDFLNRSSVTDRNGDPALTTPDADEVLQASLQHVVVTFDPVNGRRIYVNAEDTGVSDGGDATLSGWDDSYAFILGNEASNDRQWQGSIRMLAIHNRVLTDQQIQQNFDAGVGEKFMLLFAIGDLVGLANTFLVFEVSQFDNYSYLFNAPFAINLDGANLPETVDIEGMRIGINGKEANVGQSFSTLKTTLAAGTALSTPAALSPLGTIISVEKGAEADEFFLTFERLGEHENVFVDAVPSAPGTPADLPASPEVGLRTFAEVNASMSTLTGVPVETSSVRDTYVQIEQQLPAVAEIESFLSSHQMAVTQLAISYCDALVENDALRSSFFPTADFSLSAADAFAADTRDDYLMPLVDKLNGSLLSSQPDAADVRLELDKLVDQLSNCGNSCAADRTPTVVKASCAAVLGSAVMLLQ